MSNDLRLILESIHDAATDKASDVMTDPTWNLDYSFEFTLTVKQLRRIHEYLKEHPHPARLKDVREAVDRARGQAAPQRQGGYA